MVRALLKDRALIDGAWVAADGGGTIAVTNPATGATIGTVPDMGAAETRRAIAAATKAMAGWAAATAATRSRVLRRFFDLMLAEQESLATLLTSEQGKPLAEARGEIAYAASFIEWFAEEAKRVYGDVIPSFASDRRIVVLKQPVGVVGAITPWNFPAAMITRKIGPALAAGCAVVLKPASETPLTALALGVLAADAGLPPGLLNIVTGDAAAIGGELTSNADVRKISFTGSTATGRLLMRQSADTIKKLSLELGGNAPFLVFDDADPDAAVDGAIASRYRNSGQTCVCANRFYVQAGIHDVFVARLAERVAALRPGDGMAPGTDLGPLIDSRALAKVEAHVADALAKGGRLLTGGRKSALGGTFYEPTVIADGRPGMRFAHEETFGPLAGVIRFETEAEAIALANASEFGLAGYFYTKDLARAVRVAEALQCGMVGVNTGLISTEVAPFGGVKQSGVGREGSRYGIDDYVEIKYLCVGV